MSQLNYFFKPAGVALIGASSNPEKINYGILENMISFGYQGKVYPVNPSADEILGLKCYKDISAVPDPVELAVIAIPVKYVAGALEDCGKRGLKAATIISGGFKEVGAEGARLEKELVEIARRYNMRLIGPNCVGTVDLYSGLNCTFIRGLPDKGHIGFASQSGAMCGAVVDYVIERGIGFSYFVSMGNEADVTETDLIEHMANDENTHVIAAYVEGITNGERFINVVSKVTRKKPVVILKGGHSEAGARAVSSHTGSLAGSYTAYLSAFQKAGVIVAESAQELFDIANALAIQPLPRGNKVTIVTNSGGPSALASDDLAAHNLALSNLAEETTSEIRKFVNPSAQVANPIDLLGGAMPGEYAMALQHALRDPATDTALMITVPTSVVDMTDVVTEVSAAVKESSKPVLLCLMGDRSIREPRLKFQQNGLPVVQFPEQTGVVISSMLGYSQIRDRAPRLKPQVEPVNPTVRSEFLELTSKQKHLGELETRPLLQTYGIPLVPGKLAGSAEEAAEVAAEIGFPVVMKIASQDILHKSDAGGILLNLADKAAIRDGYTNIMQKIGSSHPQARLDGVMIEAMAAKGTEVIIGMRRDVQFGPLMMFGLGGIYVELFKDIAFRLAPLTIDDALEMIEETKAGKLLGGLRGAKPGDKHAIAEALVNLGRLALDFPEIKEIEINPLLVYEKGVLALDSRAIAA